MWSLLALFLLQAADHSAQGTKALDAGNYTAAVSEFQAAVAADPSDYGAHFNLGLAFTFLHRDDEGIAEYRKTLDLKPHLYEAELNAGILLLRRKDAAAAEPLEADATQQKPAEFRPRYYLAEAQLALEKWSEAAANYALALQIDPKSSNAELGLGRALAHGHKLDDAAPHYRKAVTLDPKNRDWLLELADLYEKDQKRQEALAIYQEFPDNPAVQAHLGELMLNGKQYAEAIPRLEAAFGREPSQANRVALAMAYLFDKQFAKALPMMQGAVDAQPSDFEIRMMYARALRDSRQYAAAQTQFAEAVKLKPADAPAWRDLGDMLYLNADYPRALEAFEKARALGEDTAGNCFLRAIILDKLHQLKPALETYERFLEMSQGKNPDQEFQARHRIVAIRNELKGH